MAKRRKRRECPACERPAQKWERVLLLDGGRVRTGLVCSNCASQAARMGRAGQFRRCTAPGCKRFAANECMFGTSYCSLHGELRKVFKREEFKIEKEGSKNG